MRMARYQSLIKTVVFMVFAFSAQFAFASAEDESTISKIFETHGKENVINYILSKNNGKVTIQKKKSFLNVTGRPDIKFVTAKSVVHDIGNLKIDLNKFPTELDAFISNEKDKQQKQIDNLSKSANASSNTEASLSKKLKYQIKTKLAKYNASDSYSDRRQLKKELSILKRAYRSAKKNEKSKLRVYFPDEIPKSNNKRSSSYCNNLKTQLKDLTGSVYRHQVFFCSDRKYRAKNPKSCNSSTYARQSSLQDYKAQMNRLRKDISSNCES